MSDCHLLLLIISEGQSELPESKYLRVENKVFYFDAGSNRRGVYLRVSEVCMKLVFHVKTCSFNPYKPSIFFVEHRQTVQNQIR